MVRSLTSDAWPVWHGLSLMDECRTRLRDVLAQLTPNQAPSPEEWDPGVTVRITELNGDEAAFGGRELYGPPG